MKVKIIIGDIKITDQFYTLAYNIAELGIAGHVMIPLETELTEETIRKIITEEIEKIKDKIEKVQELKKAYAGQGFILELSY